MKKEILIKKKTMKKEMVHKFPITTAHMTLIRQRETPTHEII